MITLLLSEPFYTGTGTATNVPHYLPVAINGVAYQIDPRQYRRKTIDLLPSAFVSSVDEAGERSLSPKGLWRRHQSDFRGGAGQDYFDDEDSTRIRFSRSKGMDVWTRREASLLHRCEPTVASANGNLTLMVVGGYCYFANGTTLKFTTDMSSWTTVTGGAGVDITSITTDGQHVYVARSGQLLERTVIGAGTMAGWSVAFQPTLVVYANGRLFGARSNRLAEMDAAGKVATDTSPTAGLLDYTHRTPGMRWKAIVATPGGVYASSAVGGITEVYHIGLSETVAGALGIPTIATPGFPTGETVLAMAYYGGRVLLGTDKGLRVAVIGSNNALSFGPLIEMDAPVTCFDGVGQYVWFPWTNYDSQSTGLGRLDLAREPSAPLVPAYASDLMAGSEGDELQGPVTSTVFFNGKRYFTVSAVGIWAETDELVPTGELVSGWITFSTFERKVTTSLDVRHDALHGGVALLVNYDNEENTVACGASITQGSFSPLSALDTGRQQAEQMQVRMVVTPDPDDPLVGPVVHRWTLRALPTPIRTDEILVPIIMRSKVLNSIGEGTVISFDPFAEYNQLKTLEAQGRVVAYQEGDATCEVYIDGVEVVPDHWMDDFRFFEGTVNVRLMTIAPSQ